MINYRFVARALGLLILLEGLLMSSCWIVGICYGETQWLTWAAPVALCALLGSLLLAISRGARSKFGRRDGYLVVSGVWIVFTTLGMLPFLIGGHTDRVAAAFFETMSGFTTTGGTTFANIEVLPASILFWRSLTHWIGGMGIVFFTLAFLPALGMGEQELFSAESTGISVGKLHPRISTTAHWLWGVYFLITGACILTYWLCGMSPFDAVNHAFATIATGGFSTHTASIAYFHSPAVEYAVIFFMTIASINFTLLYLLIIKRRFRQVFADEELRLFLLIYFGAVAVIVFARWMSSGVLTEETLRSTLFNTMSIMSTTGFTTEDFMIWPAPSWLMLAMVCVVGSCAGSTSGGIKVVRVVTAIKVATNEFRQIIHPRAVLPIRLNRNLLAPTITQSVFAFIFFYLIIVFIATILLSTLHLPLIDAFGLSISSFSNVGPGMGYYLNPLDAWCKLPDSALWINSFLMLAGRLEIFTLLLPFIPSFWRDN